MHEITFSTDDKPKLLSQVQTLQLFVPHKKVGPGIALDFSYIKKT